MVAGDEGLAIGVEPNVVAVNLAHQPPVRHRGG
jgi:hypothetical protein